MDQIQNLYIEFLSNFPANTRPVISIALAALLVYSVFKVIKKDFVFIIALVVLLPASKPILQSVWEGVLAFVKFLLNTK
ncbi:MAG: hypothetical protein KGJ93_03415 [Patescibacteria group bacterium]|nr:hypothetical protein [Patescibacteria group bacterium]